MIAFYANMFRRNRIKLEQIPVNWRKQVAAYLGMEV